MKLPVLLCAAVVLLGQSADPGAARRRLAESSREPGGEELQQIHSDRIARALKSQDALWAFVTSPEPMYLERRAAAFQAKGLVPVTWLPKIWRALGELQRESRRDRFGMKEHPYSSRIWMPPATVENGPRQILGRSWTPPAVPIEFPLTPDEREKAPWPWQVQAALEDLRSGLIPSTYAPLERAAADAYLSAVMTVPCGTDDEAQWFVGAAQGSSHYKNVPVMAALRNIALNPRFPQAGVQAGSTYGDATRLWNDPGSWAIGAAGTLDILQRSPHAQVRDTAAYSVRSLRQVFVDGHDRPRPIPAAVILEMSRRALDADTGDAWRRLYVYAFSVVEALDDPPFRAERGMDPQSPDVQRRLADFARWHAANRDALAALAASQKAEIDAAERLLSATAACR